MDRGVAVAKLKALAAGAGLARQRFTSGERMSSAALAGAVLYAKDLARVSRFYAQVAGMRVVEEEAGHVVLESACFQLVVVAAPAAIANSIVIEAPPKRREATPIKLIFSVDSFEDARMVAHALGGELNGPEREWESRGARVCDGCDPEGNVIQLRAPLD
jgi:predicted enzyme related to lactoylglutathione lyase